MGTVHNDRRVRLPDPELFAVKKCTLSGHSMEKFIRDRLVDDPCLRPVIPEQTDGGTEKGDLLGEIGSPVQRIYDPGVFFVMSRFTRFFRIDTEIKLLPQDADDLIFGFSVRFGNDIPGPFFLNIQGLPIIPADDLTRFPGSMDHGINDFVHYLLFFRKLPL